MGRKSSFLVLRTSGTSDVLRQLLRPLQPIRLTKMSLRLGGGTIIVKKYCNKSFVLRA